MSATYELHHRPARTAVIAYRVVPLVLLVLFSGVFAACMTALLTRDLVQGDRVGAALLGVIALVTAGLLAAVGWRLWPGGGAVIPIRLDPVGPSLLKGKLRSPSWYRVPWESISEVTYARIDLPTPPDGRPRDLRLLSFVPRPEATIPAGPPGAFDAVLNLPPRHSVLTLVVVQTWDTDIRAMLAWLQTFRPGLTVRDSVSQGQ